MAAAPTINEAITRLSENENRIDIFTNQDGYYLTNETVPRQVESLPSLVARIQDRYLNIVDKGDWTTSVNYVINDVVKESGIMYLCVTTHIAGVFATDLAANKWVVYQGDLRAADLASSAAGKGADLVGADDGASGSLWTTVAGFVSKIISSAGASVIGYISNATGAVATTLQNLFDRQSVFVANFLTADEYADGQTGSPVVDIAPKLVLAEAAARATGKRLIGCSGKYLCGSTVALNCSGDLSEMTIVADSVAFTPAIRVGTTPGGHTMNIDLKLPKVINSSHVAGDGWAEYATSVGVSLDNIYGSTIYVPMATGFGIGVYSGGADWGFGANNVTLGYIADNKINFKNGPKSSGAWANGNTFYIGSCRHNSSEGNGGVAYAGTRNIILENCNDNLLIKPTIEGSSAVTEFALELKNSNYNQIIQPRWENSAAGGASLMPVKLSAESGKGTQGNLILGGYDFGTSLAYTVEGPGVVSNNTKFGTGRGDQSFSLSNPIALNNVTGDGVTQAHLQGFSAATQIIGKSSSATDYAYRIYAAGITGKRSTDENPRVNINWSTAGILLGAGTTNALTYGVFAHLTLGLATNSDWMPQATATYNLGIASYRWNNCYLVNAPNVSSDARTKQQISPLSDIEREVAKKCRKLIRKYKLNASVAEKGDNARWHFGVIAQDVHAAFASEGLDPFAYSVCCYDKWDANDEQRDDDGNVIVEARDAGELYSIRYEELLAFIISAL